MVGDRLNTDILFGQKGGLATLLVLTGTIFLSITGALLVNEISLGITSESELTGPKASSIIPDYVTPSLGDLRIVNNV